MGIKEIDFDKYAKVMNAPLFLKMGKVVNVVGLTIESAGPDAKLGDVCEIFPEDENAKPIMVSVTNSSACHVWMELVGQKQSYLV